MGNIRTPIDTLFFILKTIKEELPESKLVFFVDLCYDTMDQQHVPNLVQLALTASTLGYYTVVAYSNDDGSMNALSTTTLSTVRNQLETLDAGLEQHESTVFSDREAKKFVDKFDVDVQRLEEDYIQVANNPYLLSLFRDTVSKRYRFELAIRSFDNKMNELAKAFISTLYNLIYSGDFNGCLELLECARHNVDLNPAQLAQYKRSYLERKYLTTLEVDEGSHRVKLLFPTMYNRVVERLKVMYRQATERLSRKT